MRAWSISTDAALSPSTAIAGRGNTRSRDASKIPTPVSQSMPTNLTRFMESALHMFGTEAKTIFAYKLDFATFVASSVTPQLTTTLTPQHAVFAGPQSFLIEE